MSETVNITLANFKIGILFALLHVHQSIIYKFYIVKNVYNKRIDVIQNF